jgi:hypothetical protein
VTLAIDELDRRFFIASGAALDAYSALDNWAREELQSRASDSRLWSISRAQDFGEALARAGWIATEDAAGNIVDLHLAHTDMSSGTYEMAIKSLQAIAPFVKAGSLIRLIVEGENIELRFDGLQMVETTF